MNVTIEERPPSSAFVEALGEEGDVLGIAADLEDAAEEGVPRGTTYWTASVDGADVGVAVVEHQATYENLSDLYVLAPMRRRGISGALRAQVLNYARSPVVLTPAAGHREAQIKALLRAGWRPVTAADAARLRSPDLADRLANRTLSLVYDKTAANPARNRFDIQALKERLLR